MRRPSSTFRLVREARRRAPEAGRDGQGPAVLPEGPWSCSRRWPRPTPTNWPAKGQPVLVVQQLGDVHLRLGSTDKALESYQKGLELREALAKADPNYGGEARPVRLLFRISSSSRANRRSRSGPELVRKVAGGRHAARPDVARSAPAPRGRCRLRDPEPESVRDPGTGGLPRAMPGKPSITRGKRAVWPETTSRSSGFLDHLGMLATAQTGAGELKEARQSSRRP